MTPAEYLAQVQAILDTAMRKPCVAPPETRRSECCSRPPLDGEIDADGYARCGRCHEFAKFEVTNA